MFDYLRALETPGLAQKKQQHHRQAEKTAQPLSPQINPSVSSLFNLEETLNQQEGHSLAENTAAASATE